MFSIQCIQCLFTTFLFTPQVSFPIPIVTGPPTPTQGRYERGVREFCWHWFMVAADVKVLPVVRVLGGPVHLKE